MQNRLNEHFARLLEQPFVQPLDDELVARAHARSGDPVAIASYLGSGDSFDRALATFAEAYADQNERDYAALQRAVDDGRVAAATG